MAPLVAALEVRGFRSIRHSDLALEPLSALVGEPEAGKSNLLAALRAVLDPDARLRASDRPRGDGGELALEARLGAGGVLRLAGDPPVRSGDGTPPHVLYLPASARAGAVLAYPEDAGAHRAATVFRDALRATPTSSEAAPALAAVRAIEACRAARLRRVVVLMEEPELYLRPQGQRFLYRLLRDFAAAGNQVVYSTHSPAFLNAARLHEVVFVEQLPSEGTRAARPDPLTPDEDFRVLSEFDAERSELLLARAVLLVEGLTEKLAFPFVFAALGLDADREGVTIVECGGKANIPLFARICAAAGIPFVAVHDRDAVPGHRPKAGERVLNELIREVAGPERTVVVQPDFEGISHLPGGSRKPEQAWRRFASLNARAMPAPLVRAARMAVALARGAPL